MLTCRIHAKDDLRVDTDAEPAVGPGEVLIHLGAGGICGSDLHYYFEGRNGSFVIREPLVPGHEASGVVAKVGAGVTRVAPGDKIAVSPSQACGRCEYCRGGREHLCRNMRFLGSASVYPHVQGMFAEYFVLGERQCYPVSGDVSLGELAFAEPLAVGLHAVNRAGDLLGKSVFVTGAGTIGCLTMIAAKLKGATSVTASDVLDRPLETARAVGAVRTIRADKEPDAIASPQFDVAFEASGSLAALNACIAAVKRGGTVVQVGTLPQGRIPLGARVRLGGGVHRLAPGRCRAVVVASVSAATGRASVSARPGQDAQHESATRCGVSAKQPRHSGQNCPGEKTSAGSHSHHLIF
jgi:L-idonate 5-dehydrogenase